MHLAHKALGLFGWWVPVFLGAVLCYGMLCYAVPIASLAAPGFAVQQGRGLRTRTRGEVFAALPAGCCMVAGCVWVFLGTRPAAKAGLTCAFGAVSWAQQLLRLLDCGGLPNVCVLSVCSRRQCLRTLCCAVLCCRLPSQACRAVPCRLPGCSLLLNLLKTCVQLMWRGAVFCSITSCVVSCGGCGGDDVTAGVCTC